MHVCVCVRQPTHFFRIVRIRYFGSYPKRHVHVATTRSLTMEKQKYFSETIWVHVIV